MPRICWLIPVFCDRGSLVLTSFDYIGSDDPTAVGEHTDELASWAAR